MSFLSLCLLKTKQKICPFCLYVLLKNNLKYVFFVFMSSENQTENMSFLSLCLNSSVFLFKNKNEDQSSIRPSLAPFSFQLFFLF